ncbi:MAG: hypothetical protein ACD_80C00181G0008 [uncultured bacterium (gcode 4)]|uniref:Four helix bundle protein n=1 Tax=uncultured bacterium (gcode 4) TaxID=1234023 RepID=K1XHT1_9BACT|nr:MAG: hypothetical protein ACD_80C00181G0008 [uncultured bacterium (gcode 4)]
MKDNIILQKTYDFSIEIVYVYKFLVENKKEFVLSKQLLRSWTSIGANVEEAIWWQSKKDFLSKMSIAYKEARETKYRLRILKDTSFLPEEKFQPLINKVEEILKILWAIQKSLKANEQ